MPLEILVVGGNTDQTYWKAMVQFSVSEEKKLGGAGSLQLITRPHLDTALVSQSGVSTQISSSGKVDYDYDQFGSGGYLSDQLCAQELQCSD